MGGWNALGKALLKSEWLCVVGINPALFAWELMECAKVSAQIQTEPSPMTILTEAFSMVKENGNVAAGSSTATILTFGKYWSVFLFFKP